MSPVPHTPAAPFTATLPTLRLVRSPHSVRILAGILCVLIAAVVAGLIGLPWQQSVSGEGRVVAFSPTERHQRLEAPIDGRIARINVIEGQFADVDDVVVEIVDVDPRFMERLESERALVRLRQEAAQQRRAQVSDRVLALQQGREMALAAAAARRDMAKDRVAQAEQSQVAAAAAKDAVVDHLSQKSHKT